MALHDTVRAMASVPALAALDPEALRLIAFSAETRILRAGDVLFSEGEPSDCGYVVLSGSIALQTGAGPAIKVGPPTLIGEAALIAETIRPAGARAHAPSSVLKISRILFHRVLSEYPEGAARVRRIVAERLLGLQGELTALREAGLYL